MNVEEFPFGEFEEPVDAKDLENFVVAIIEKFEFPNESFTTDIRLIFNIFSKLGYINTSEVIILFDTINAGNLGMNSVFNQNPKFGIKCYKSKGNTHISTEIEVETTTGQVINKSVSQYSNNH